MAHSRAQEEEAESTLPEMQETRPGIDQSAKERKNGGRGASLMDWILRKEPCKHKALLPADRPSHQGRDKNKNNTVKAKETTRKNKKKKRNSPDRPGGEYNWQLLHDMQPGGARHSRRGEGA